MVWWGPSSVPDFSLNAHVLEGVRQLSGVLLIRVLIPLIRAPPSWLKLLPKVPPPTAMALGFRISKYDFGGNTNIETTASGMNWFAFLQLPLATGLKTLGGQDMVVRAETGSYFGDYCRHPTSEAWAWINAVMIVRSGNTDAWWKEANGICLWNNYGMKRKENHQRCLQGFLTREMEEWSCHLLRGERLQDELFLRKKCENKNLES